jgi:hypothetical protein
MAEKGHRIHAKTKAAPKASKRGRHGGPLLTHLSRSFLKSITPVFRLLSEMPDGSDPEAILKTLLDIIRKITGARRAEISRWNSERGHLVIVAQSGPRPRHACAVGADVPEGGMQMRVWKRTGSAAVFSNRLQPGHGYIKADERTRAEAAIRIQHKKRKIGVLNVE